MKKSLLLLMIISLFILNYSSEAQVKRVLLEQHTGAWCGWCVDGTVVMDQILNAYPDNVIGVKIHNGDSMAIAEQGEIGNRLSCPGFPSGTIDRKAFGGAVFSYRDKWMQVCESAMKSLPKIDLQAYYELDKTTRELKCKLYATMSETVNQQLKFNLYIIEDDVSGTGKGWDQSNYLSNRAGYEDNPYYNEPNPIVGYHHMKVVREMLGGAWGLQGEFPNPAENGQIYTHEFITTISDVYDIDKLHFVALVQVDDPSSYEILNSAIAKEGAPLWQFTSSGPRKMALNAGTPMEKTFTLKNISEQEMTFQLSLEKSARTPADWTAEYTHDGNTVVDITLGAGATADIVLSLTPGPTRGLGDAAIIVEVKDNPDAFKAKGNIAAVSKEIDHFELISAGEDDYELTSQLHAAGYTEFTKVPLEDYMEFRDVFADKKIMIWNSGSAAGLGSADAAEILKSINDGIGVFVCGNQSMSNLSNAGALGSFGAAYNGYSTQGYGQAPWRVWLAGVPADPIGGALGTSLEGNLIKYLITLLKITDTRNTKPFMHFRDMGKHIVVNGQTRDTSDIEGEDAIFGIRVQKDESRAVLFSITPHVIVDNNIRETLLDNIIIWLRNTGPEITSNLSRIRFGQVNTGEDKETVLALKNSGKEQLSINSITLEGDDAYAFEIEVEGDFPIFLEPGATQVVKVKFSAFAEYDYMADLIVESNSDLNPDLTIPVEGQGIIVSVDENDPTVGYIYVSPNPATEDASINYSVIGKNAVPVRISVYSSSGMKVYDLNSGLKLPGEYRHTLDKDLASGSYFLVMTINGKVYNSSFNIVR